MAGGQHDRAMEMEAFQFQFHPTNLGHQPVALKTLTLSVVKVHLKQADAVLRTVDKVFGTGDQHVPTEGHRCHPWHLPLSPRRKRCHRTACWQTKVQYTIVAVREGSSARVGSLAGCRPTLPRNGVPCGALVRIV